jgi:hypothetical protein
MRNARSNAGLASEKEAEKEKMIKSLRERLFEAESQLRCDRPSLNSAS